MLLVQIKAKKQVVCGKFQLFIARQCPENHSTSFKTRFSAKSPGANGLSKSLRRPLLRRPEVKKPRNDSVRILGNDLSPQRFFLFLFLSRSAKSYDVKSCLLAQSLLREYKSRLFSYFLRSLVLKAIIDCFSLYQESIRGFWFSSEYVFLAFSQFEISILKRVCHEFYAAPWPQKIRQYKQRLDENRQHDCQQQS